MGATFCHRVSAVLWTLISINGTVLSFVSSFKTWVANHLANADVHLVLDRYYDYSTKSSTRAARAAEMIHTRVHKLSMKI